MFTIRLWCLALCAAFCRSSCLSLSVSSGQLRAVASLDPAQCTTFQESMLIKPPPSCEVVGFSTGDKACLCRMTLPANMKPMPDMMLVTPADPESQEGPVEDGVGLIPPFHPPTWGSPEVRHEGSQEGSVQSSSVPQGTSQAAAVALPNTAPSCPFETKCPASGTFSCVDFAKWGFAEVAQTDYTPASGYLNIIECSYTMRRGGTFKVPEKVVAFKAMQSRHQDVLAWYQRGIIFNCHEQIETTWGKMCEDKAHKEHFSCDMPWRWLFEDCGTLAAPPGFSVNSTLQELCPLECGFVPGTVSWPR